MICGGTRDRWLTFYRLGDGGTWAWGGFTTRRHAPHPGCWCHPEVKPLANGVTLILHEPIGDA